MENGETKRCVVIGAGGGIGSELCPMLIEDGWELVIAGRTGSKIKQTQEKLGEAVIAAEEIEASDFGQVEELFGKHDGLTGAVNLAGSIVIKPAHATDQDELDETIRQNLTTAFAVTRAAGKSMRRGGGSVVLMSSCAGQAGLANHEAISAAKAGVSGLVRAAASTYASNRLRFNAVAPGLVDTPLASHITGNEASLKASKAMHPLGRIGEPREVARMIAMLLSPESSWITGQVIGVDGGISGVRGK